MEKIVLAGGCFWCTEAIFKRLKGVTGVISGYANGAGENPRYEQVSTGETGFAEAVEVEFDPQVIAFPKLLEIFWATHDPTTLNRQGGDIGTQYRSAIYYTTDEQRQTAEKSKELMGAKEIAGRPIVTVIEPLKSFFTAEEYHQNYYERNLSSNPYCSLVISPKIGKLLEKFNSEVQEEYRM